MLVLSRKRNERIVICRGGEVLATVTLVEVRADKARLGFEADQAIAIHREEVYRRIQEDGHVAG